ncbi:MAG TPA: ATP-binding protein [Blastococcus sp.]|nr:ATP-binding protein [Blastococcus sp.]
MTPDRSQEGRGDALPGLRVEGDDTGSVVEIAQIPPSAGHRGWRLPSVPSSVPLLRRGLRAFLEDAGRSQEELEDLVLATCEAATNAEEHAQHATKPFFDVAVQIVDDVVTIVVTDHGQWRPPTPSPYRGRGLAMMHMLADTTLVPGPHGTTVILRTHCAVADAAARDDGRAS